MEKNKIFLIGGIIITLLIIGGIVYVWFDSGQISQKDRKEEQISVTRENVPSGTTVPGMDANVSGGIAKPLTVSLAAPGVSYEKRVFEIRAEGGKFTPSEVIAYVGDIVTIKITAVDGAYDFTQPDYGLSLKIPKGETKILETQFVSEGKFKFYCVSCGGPNKGPIGYIIAVKK